MFLNISSNIRYLLLAISVLILIALGLLFPDFFFNWHWVHSEFHSSIETLGGVTSILISLIIFRESQSSLDYRMVMIATGFACMGVLDMSHAMSKPGDAFIFLHSMASFSCGFFFAMVWVAHGRRLKGKFEHYFIYFGSLILALSVALRALIYPEDVPKIMPLFDGKFTMAAVIINTAASIMFLIALPKFFRIYRKDNNPRDLLFIFMSLLFGFAEIIFQFSMLWDGIWWFWHLLRLTAFLVTLVFLFRSYQNMSDSYRLYVNGNKED